MTISELELTQLRGFVGESHDLRPWHRVATADAIWHFAAAVGDDNPLWHNATYAATTRFGGIVAPPSYFYTCDRGLARPGESDLSSLRDQLLPDVPSVWSRSQWTWNRPLAEGEAVSSTWSLLAADLRTDGVSIRQRERFSHVDGDGHPIAEEIREILRRRPTVTGSSAGSRSPRYTAAERNEISAAYHEEASAGKRARAERWAAVREGDSLGRITKGPLTLMNLVNWLTGWGSPVAYTNRLLWRYLEAHPASAVVDDEFQLQEPRELRHIKPSSALESPFQDGYDFGAQRISWVIHLLTDWAGDNGVLRSLDVRLLGPNPVGSLVHLGGRVTAVFEGDNGEKMVRAEVFCEQGDGGSRIAAGDALIELHA